MLGVFRTAMPVRLKAEKEVGGLWRSLDGGGESALW